MPTDAARVRAALGTPELRRFVARCRTRLARGQGLTGTLTLAAPGDAERVALARLVGARPGRGAGVRVDLDEVSQVLAAAGVADDLAAAVVSLTGPVTDARALRDAHGQALHGALRSLARGRHAGHDWHRSWVQLLQDDGTLTRWVRRGDAALAAHATAVLDLLPGDGTVPLPVLAERATGDTKALAGTPLARAVLRAVALWVVQDGGTAVVGERAGDSTGAVVADDRELWERVGVVPDDLSSQVLVLGVRATGGAGAGPVGEWLEGAARLGVPFRLTLHQLGLAPLVPGGPVLHVCENPAVLRLAAARWGAACAPLVCTEGAPSAACRQLVGAAARAGVRVMWHSDLDWAGLRFTADALARYGASPWRMGTADYLAGVAEGGSEPLRGAPAVSPWDPDLAVAMAREQTAVMEERLVGALLADLGPGAGHG